MSRNGVGTFIVNTAGQPVVTGTTILSTAFNALTADLATGLTQSICIDGQTPTTGTIPFSQGLKATTLDEFTANAGTRVQGTTANPATNAPLGYVGEYVEALVASGAPVSLTSPNPSNITSISLTAGDWDVCGVVFFGGGAATTVVYIFAGIGTASATLPGNVNTTRNSLFLNSAAVYATLDQPLVVAPARFSLNTTTTVYLVAQSQFAVSTSVAYGQIRARRVR